MRGLALKNYIPTFYLNSPINWFDRIKKGEIIPICKQITYFRCSRYRRFTTKIKMVLKKTIKNSWILLCMAIWMFSTNTSANPEPQFVHGVNPYFNTGINTGTSFEVSIAILLYAVNICSVREKLHDPY